MMKEGIIVLAENKIDCLTSVWEEVKAKCPDIILEFKYGHDVLVIDRLIIPKEGRNKGVGTYTLNLIKSFCDSKALILMLSPSIEFGATSIERLKKFYRRFGFVSNSGKKKIYQLPLYSMYRLPGH